MAETVKAKTWGLHRVLTVTVTVRVTGALIVPARYHVRSHP